MFNLNSRIIMNKIESLILAIAGSFVEINITLNNGFYYKSSVISYDNVTKNAIVDSDGYVKTININDIIKIDLCITVDWNHIEWYKNDCDKYIDNII